MIEKEIVSLLLNTATNELHLPIEQMNYSLSLSIQQQNLLKKVF